MNVIIFTGLGLWEGWLMHGFVSPPGATLAMVYRVRKVGHRFPHFSTYAARPVILFPQTSPLRAVPSFPNGHGIARVMYTNV